MMCPIDESIKHVLPERATMSAWDNPWEANRELSWFKLKVDLGSFPFTLVEVELSPSNLPNSTEYEGPPDCRVNTFDCN